jgi:hypothetical protein
LSCEREDHAVSAAHEFWPAPGRDPPSASPARCTARRRAPWSVEQSSPAESVYGGDPAPVASRRPPPPSRRAQRADLSRAAFLTLVLGWVLAESALLAAVLAIRRLG